MTTQTEEAWKTISRKQSTKKEHGGHRINRIGSLWHENQALKR